MRYLDTNSKPVYMLTTDNTLIKIFDTTRECSLFFDKEKEYINHSIWKGMRIRKNGRWYRLVRKEKYEEIEKRRKYERKIRKI